MRLQDLVYGDIVSFTDLSRHRRVFRVVEIVETMREHPDNSSLQAMHVLKGWDMADPDQDKDIVAVCEDDMDNLYRIASQGSFVVIPETIFKRPDHYTGEQLVRMYNASHVTESARRIYGTARWDEKAEVIVIPPVVHAESMTILPCHGEVYLRFRNKHGRILCLSFKTSQPEREDTAEMIRVDLSKDRVQEIIKDLTEHFPAP
jgi:hypothetical protein